MKFYVLAVFENLSKNASFIKIWQQQRGPYMKTTRYFFISSQIILRMRNVSDISFR
jgi:hypothetical protein